MLNVVENTVYLVISIRVPDWRYELLTVFGAFMVYSFRSAQTAFRRMRQLRSLSREAYHDFAFVITPICR